MTTHLKTDRISWPWPSTVPHASSSPCATAVPRPVTGPACTSLLLGSPLDINSPLAMHREHAPPSGGSTARKIRNLLKCDWHVQLGRDYWRERNKFELTEAGLSCGHRRDCHGVSVELAHWFMSTGARASAPLNAVKICSKVPSRSLLGSEVYHFSPVFISAQKPSQRLLRQRSRAWQCSERARRTCALDVPSEVPE